MSDIRYVYPLIHNKVTSPHYVTPTLRRGRLLDWLDASANCRAVVIAADAGYGKTTLLWQWEREVSFPCYWYKLDRNDRDWSLHISYLIEAISQRHAGFGRRAHSMLQQLGGPGSSRPGVAAYLLAEMYDRLTEPCTFIIDDWQFVASVTEVRGLWNQILRDAPPTCRFIFLSRAKPHLQFARFKTHAGYAELRTDALRFTDREIDELFRDIYNDPLDPSELAELEQRTEGWAASLQLVEVSLRERTTAEERRAFIRSITATSDNDLFSFLAEEVLDQQNEQTRNFLLSTSILHQITPELAERLAGVQSGVRILAELEQRGLFTYRLDVAEARYRYHGLFRDFLERRLSAERSEGEVVGLHIHAASYYETHAQWPQAIHHYLKAGLQPQAARLIARFGEDVVAEGRLGLVDEWLPQLPEKTVRDNARLSLLYGEANGMRGAWTTAMSALMRSRVFFARKGDRRMEALACLKLSTVHTGHGDVALAASTALEGLHLAPDDAFATRLRLQGNLAITSTWMEDPAEEVAKTCRRIAVEATSRGLLHFAAIALHNLGMIQRQIGDLEHSVQNLELAAKFWADGPANPFADNAELVQSLLWSGDATRAALVAAAGVERTRPWPRPHAEARFGLASHFAHTGEFEQAAELARAILAERDVLGPTAELVGALLIEANFLRGVDARENELVLEGLEAGPTDPRQGPLMAPIRAVVRHSNSRCRGECLTHLDELRDWDARGLRLQVTVGMVKIGAVALDHPNRESLALARMAADRLRSPGLARHLRWWLRRYSPHAKALATTDAGSSAVLRLAELDPDGWREALIALLPAQTGATRDRIIGAVGRQSNNQTVKALAGLSGEDIVQLRRAITRKHASRFLIRSFGSLAIHRSGWEGQIVAVDKRRQRMLLGLLVSHFRQTLTRDQALDVLWPDSDPTSAVNSLNQTVFQLRRLFDPTYRGGESPQYVVSTVDTVFLNPELIRTDLDQLRQKANELRSRPGIASRELPALLNLIRGEFLAELKYDDWAARIRTAVHAEVRSVLLPLAQGAGSLSPDLAVRAACALVELDEYDEPAQAAVAEQLMAAGKVTAARTAMSRFAQKLQRDGLEPVTAEVGDVMSRLGISVEVH